MREETYRIATVISCRKGWLGISGSLADAESGKHYPFSGKVLEAGEVPEAGSSVEYALDRRGKKVTRIRRVTADGPSEEQFVEQKTAEQPSAEAPAPEPAGEEETAAVPVPEASVPETSVPEECAETGKAPVPGESVPEEGRPESAEEEQEEAAKEDAENGEIIPEGAVDAPEAVTEPETAETAGDETSEDEAPSAPQEGETPERAEPDAAQPEGAQPEETEPVAPEDLRMLLIRELEEKGALSEEDFYRFVSLHGGEERVPGEKLGYCLTRCFGGTAVTAAAENGDGSTVVLSRFVTDPVSEEAKAGIEEAILSEIGEAGFFDGQHFVKVLASNGIEDYRRYARSIRSFAETLFDGKYTVLNKVRIGGRMRPKVLVKAEDVRSILEASKAEHAKKREEAKAEAGAGEALDEAKLARIRSILDREIGKSGFLFISRLPEVLKEAGLAGIRSYASGASAFFGRYLSDAYERKLKYEYRGKTFTDVIIRKDQPAEEKDGAQDLNRVIHDLYAAGRCAELVRLPQLKTVDPAALGPESVKRILLAFLTVKNGEGSTGEEGTGKNREEASPLPIE